MLLALPAEGELLLVVFTSHHRKTLARSLAAYQVLGDVLIYSSNRNTSGTAAVVGVTILHNSMSFSRICLSSAQAT